MSKFYSIYGALVLLSFMFSAYEGYAFSSLFENHHHGGRGGSSVWINSHSYHK